MTSKYKCKKSKLYFEFGEVFGIEYYRNRTFPAHSQIFPAYSPFPRLPPGYPPNQGFPPVPTSNGYPGQEKRAREGMEEDARSVKIIDCFLDWLYKLLASLLGGLKLVRILTKVALIVLNIRFI